MIGNLDIRVDDRVVKNVTNEIGKPGRNGKGEKGMSYI